MNKKLKVLFWLLLGVNVTVFALLKVGLLGSDSPEPVLHPLNADKIVLQSEVKSAPVAAAPVVPAPMAEAVAASAPVVSKPAELTCMEWGEFSGAELEQVELALKKLSLGDKLERREIDHSIGYWVYIAPLKDKVAVSQKVAQLKARGVTDYFVVQEAGEWQNAISLGVFKSRESAQKFLEGLRAKEVSSAQMGERAGKNKTKSLLINKIDSTLRAKLIVLQKNFAESELKTTSCH